MRRILYDVSRWHLFVHRDARGLPPAVANDDARRMIEDELFERLYSGGGERLSDVDGSSPPHAWATRLHDTCDRLPSFSRLMAECRGNDVAAAAAVEALIEQLQPPTDADEQPPRGEPAIRRAVSRGCEEASTVISELRDALDGLSHVSVPGTATVSPSEASGDGSRARTIAGKLRGDRRLLEIAKLAGRFKRLLGGKRRQRVRRGADEVTSVEAGAELERLLPVELVRITRPIHRLAFFRDLLERQCLQYALTGREARGRGPLVVCLDKSSSMTGDPDAFATAAALALLDIAQRERRDFALLCFNGAVCFEALVHPGDRLPEAGLFVPCDGGTSIADAIERGLELIAAHPGSLRRADLVLITDGSSDTTQAGELRGRATALGVNILGLGIGVAPDTLLPWCTEVQLVRGLESLDDETLAAMADI